ncbi:MAG: hypothetical protein RI894_1020 [Bacteroidota bacterium]
MVKYESVMAVRCGHWLLCKHKAHKQIFGSVCALFSRVKNYCDVGCDVGFM